MSGSTQHDPTSEEELIWPASREQDDWQSSSLESLRIPAWVDAPTEPNIRAGQHVARTAGTAPEWPRPARPGAGERLLRHAESAQFSMRYGTLAIILLLGAGILAALTTGIPFFGGNGSSPHGVQANPLATTTPLPPATATRAPTATLAPTATFVPTITPVPAITPLPIDTPSPVISPDPTATIGPTAQPAPSATATPRSPPTPTPSADPRATPPP